MKIIKKKFIFINSKFNKLRNIKHLNETIYLFEKCVKNKQKFIKLIITIPNI